MSECARRFFLGPQWAQCPPPRGQDRPLDLGLSWHKGRQCPRSGSCAAVRSKCLDCGPLGLAGLFLTNGRSALPRPAVGLRGDAVCSPWVGRPWWKHGAKELRSHSCMLRTNRIFKLLFQFREDLGTSSASGLQGGAPLLLFTRCCCEHREELFFSLEGRDGGWGGGRRCLCSALELLAAPEVPSFPRLGCEEASSQPNSVNWAHHTSSRTLLHATRIEKSPSVTSHAAFLWVLKPINLMDTITHWRLWTKSPGLIVGRRCLF